MLAHTFFKCSAGQNKHVWWLTALQGCPLAFFDQGGRDKEWGGQSHLFSLTWEVIQLHGIVAQMGRPRPIIQRGH